MLRASYEKKKAILDTHDLSVIILYRRPISIGLSETAKYYI